MTNPWMKFYPQDWRSDEKLRICSVAARGLWVEMLCIMHRSERYGHLLVNGQVPNDNALSVLCGVSPNELSELTGELEQAGVFSRNGEGVIYSRRMVKDHQKSNVGRKSVKKRWKNEKSTADQSTETKDKNPAPNRYPNRTPSTKKPEARSQNRGKPPNSPPDVDPAVWNDFVQLRKAKRAPITDTAMEGIRKQATIAGWSLEQALREMVSRGWQGFKAEWVTDNGGKNGAGNHQQRGTDWVTAMLRADTEVLEANRHGVDVWELTDCDEGG